MKWKDNEQSTNLEDRRGSGRSKAAIGGGGALLILVIGLLLGVDPKQLTQQISQSQQGAGEAGAGSGAEPTARELEQRAFTATVLRFTETVWEEQFRKAGQQYTPPRMVLFSEAVSTGGCGDAPSAAGPFYCPADRTVYLDPTFFDELAQNLGGSKAEFSQAYVIAHEIGHHVQNLLGYSDLVDKKRRTLPPAEFNEWSVRLELQADYLAGVWAYQGQRKFRFVEAGDVEEAIASANAIGDDRLQKRSTGFTSPEKYTHGTSQQRTRWFTRGLKTGDFAAMKELFSTPYEQL